MAISAGYLTTCGLTEAHEAVCWSVLNERLQIDAPATEFAAISTGSTGSACGLTLDGSVLCWGRSGREEEDAPPGAYLAISAGGGPACALTDTGEAVCWGSLAGWEYQNVGPPRGTYTAISVGLHVGCVLADQGQAICWGSFGHTKDGPYYGDSEAPPGRYTSISVGRYRVCALTEAGDVVCWGDASYQERSPAYIDYLL